MLKGLLIAGGVCALAFVAVMVAVGPGGGAPTPDQVARSCDEQFAGDAEGSQRCQLAIIARTLADQQDAKLAAAAAAVR
jgi:hypothetical protein